MKREACARPPAPWASGATAGCSTIDSPAELRDIGVDELARVTSGNARAVLPRLLSDD